MTSHYTSMFARWKRGDTHVVERGFELVTGKRRAYVRRGQEIVMVLDRDHVRFMDPDPDKALAGLYRTAVKSLISEASGLYVRSDGEATVTYGDGEPVPIRPNVPFPYQGSKPGKNENHD